MSIVRICVSDAGPLTPQRDAGSRAAADAIQTLRRLGHDVEFHPVSQVENLEVFDLFVASRPGPAVHALAVPGFGRIPSIYFGHDLHFQRMAVTTDEARARAFQRLEAMCWRAYDLSVYPSAEEVEFVDTFLGAPSALAIPIYLMGETDRGNVAKSENPTCVFVGSSGHAPNQAAMLWLIEEIWPNVRDSSSASLHLVGDWALPLSLTKKMSIFVHPHVSETRLNDLVTGSWLSLAPLPFGSGVKRKVVHALHCGTPVLGTRFAFQGLESESGRVVGGVVADTAPDTAALAVKLLEDRNLLSHLAADGKKWIGSRYSPNALLENWTRVIGTAQKAFSKRTNDSGQDDL
jgi:glycosyltransferase involved in cell wall biosynthesis